MADPGSPAGHFLPAAFRNVSALADGTVVAAAPALVLFDLDRTLVRGSSLVHLARSLVEAGLVRRATLVGALAKNTAYTWRGASDQTATKTRDGVLAMVAGMECARLRDLLPGVVARAVAAVPSPARELVDGHLADGDRCVVLSASPQELVAAVASALGVPWAVGTRAEVVDGRYTGRLDGPFCYGAHKLRRLADELGELALDDAHAYADSASDLPVLQAVGRPVAVNPDRRLHEAARTGGWPVLRF